MKINEFPNGAKCQIIQNRRLQTVPDSFPICMNVDLQLGEGRIWLGDFFRCFLFEIEAGPCKFIEMSTILQIILFHFNIVDLFQSENQGLGSLLGTSIVSRELSSL